MVKKMLWPIAVALASAILIFMAGYGTGKRSLRNMHSGEQKDTLYLHDTITSPASTGTAIPKGFELVPAGTADKIASYEALILLYKDSLERKPSLVSIRDTAYIAVPTSEYKFTDGKTYECAVSGYNARMLWHKSFQTTAIVPQEIYRVPKWNLSQGFGVYASQDFFAITSSISLDICASSNRRLIFAPEFGYGLAYAGGVARHGFYGGVTARYNLIRSKQ